MSVFSDIKMCAIQQTAPLEFAETLSLFLIVGPFWLVVAIGLVPLLLHFYVKRINRLMCELPGDKVSYEGQLDALHKTQPYIESGDPDCLLRQIKQHANANHVKLLAIVFLFLIGLSLSLVLSESFSDASLTLWDRFFLALLIGGIVCLPIFNFLYQSHLVALVLGTLIAVATLVYTALELPYQSVTDRTELIQGAAFIIVLIPAFYMALCAEKIKRLVPYFTIVLTLAPVFTYFTVFAFYSLNCLTGHFLLPGLFDVLVLFCGVVGYFVWVYAGLRAIGSLYSKRVVSEQQLGFVCWFVVTALTYLLLLQVEDDDSVQLISSALLIPPLLIITVYVYLELSRSKPFLSRPFSLLYLRVFRESNESLKLFHSVARSWRYLGPVNLIAGPDFAKVAVEPNEIYSFLSRRLRHLFIRSEHDATAALGKPLAMPDPDGRYRVNEFFCFDNIWSHVAKHLITSSDHVLVDLREFSFKNMGTALELTLIAETGSLGKTLFVIDSLHKRNEVIDVVLRLTGYTIDQTQIACVDVDAALDLSMDILSVRQLSTANSYLYNSAKKTISLNSESAQQERIVYQQGLLDAHHTKRYPFSFSFFLISLLGALLGYGLQYVAPVYLKARGVSWARTLRVLALVIILSVAGSSLMHLSIQETVMESEINYEWHLLMPGLGILLFGILTVCIYISRKVNRWIAEGKEPLKTALSNK